MGASSKFYARSEETLKVGVVLSLSGTVGSDYLCN